MFILFKLDVLNVYVIPLVDYVLVVLRLAEDFHSYFAIIFHPSEAFENVTRLPLSSFSIHLKACVSFQHRQVARELGEFLTVDRHEESQ